MKFTKNQNIKISIIITFVTMIISIVSQFFFTPFLINKVSDAQYGLYGFANSCLTWLTVAVNAILAAYNKIAAEQIAKDKEHGEEKTNSVYTIIVLVWAGIVAVISALLIIFMSTGVINLSAYNDKDKQTIMILFSIVAIQMVITVATKVATLNITFNDRHIWVKTSTLLVTLLYPIISIPFVIKGYGIITVVIIQVVLNIISHIIDLLFDRFVLKKKFSLRITPEIKKMFKPIFLYCSVILINEIAFQLNNTIDSIVLGSKGYSSEITLYQLATSIVVIASTCTNMIYLPFIPTIFRNEANGNREENLLLFNKITYIQLMLWLMITGGFIACGYNFVLMWVGSDRYIVYYVCLTLFVIQSLPSCEGPARDMMRASNNHWQRAILAICVAALNAIITIILVNVLEKSFVLWSCLIGTGVSTFIGFWVISCVMSYHYLHVDIKRFIFNYLKFALYAAIGAIIPMVLTKYCLANRINSNIGLFVIQGVIFVIIYGALCLVFDKKEIKSIFKLLKEKK